MIGSAARHWAKEGEDALQVSRGLFGALCVAMIFSAGGIVVLTAIQWSRSDPELQSALSLPGAVELSGRAGHTHAVDVEVGKTPLLVQAETLARYLNPPRPPSTPVLPVPKPRAVPAPPLIHPTVASPQFRLCATCCYMSNRAASRALIWEPGGDGQKRRWVKEGDYLGHFVVQEIRSGAIVCLNGRQRHELRVESAPPRIALVQRYEPASTHTGAIPVASPLATEVDMVEGKAR